MEERTPLLVDNEAVSTASKPVTPLPKLQLFCVYFIQFAEPVTATVVYPFIVQLVRDTGIAGGVEARNGYYAGFIVRANRMLMVFRNTTEFDLYRNQYSMRLKL